MTPQFAFALAATLIVTTAICALLTAGRSRGWRREEAS